MAFGIALLFVIVLSLGGLGAAAPQVPCFFIFGDSLVDPGNNNELDTKAKANFFPYGVDFPHGPTGRFTNGRTSADIIGQFLGFKDWIPPFAKVEDNDTCTLQGVNYASGGAGIDNDTGKHFGEVISLEKQLQNHNTSVCRTYQLLGNESEAKDHLGKCLYLFNIGSNDYLNNYFHPGYNISSINTTEEYATILVDIYCQQLKTLYDLGSRKIVLSPIGPIGCIPEDCVKLGYGCGCNSSISDAVKLFNDKLKDLVDELNNDYKDAKFVLLQIPSKKLAKPMFHRFKVWKTSCCYVSNTTGLCVEGLLPCHFRGVHLFYDNFHPSELVNILVGLGAFLQLKSLI